MADRHFPSVRWTETDAAAKAVQLLESDGKVRIDFPADFHHSLYSHVCGRNSAHHEHIDVSGGAELLARVAEIRALRELSTLSELASSISAKVHIQSPAPTIFVERGP